MVVRDKLYKDDEEKFLQYNYFEFMEDQSYSSIKLVLGVGRKVTSRKWEVLNCMYSKIGTKDVSDDEEIIKKDLFIILDDISSNIPKNICGLE